MHADMSLLLYLASLYLFLKRPAETAKIIRERGHDETFIVGVTGNILPEDVKYFLSCGANSVLPKPFTMRALERLWIKHGVFSTVESSKNTIQSSGSSSASHHRPSTPETHHLPSTPETSPGCHHSSTPTVLWL
mmetsp:Transcript_36093/g.87258  ORF Transcript_36093/g.87258 Transcript_36093/m.87258 type:complete len:134 (+) Transcript_36093:903-1304(+)